MIAETVASYLKDTEPLSANPRPTWLTSIAWNSSPATAQSTASRMLSAKTCWRSFASYMSSTADRARAYNQAVIVSQLLKATGLTKLLRNRDWPEYVEPIRAIYEEEEIQALLKACEEDERSLSLLPSDRAS